MALNDEQNIVLIGMPGSGKSTVGSLLAHKMDKIFIDSDLLIEKDYGHALQKILDTHGYIALRKIEEDTLCNIHVKSHVIATGGSAVYNEKAMKHLCKTATIVFLETPFTIIKDRIGNFSQRGLARQPGQDLLGLYEERTPLYQKYADSIVSTENHTPDEVCSILMNHLLAKPPPT